MTLSVSYRKVLFSYMRELDCSESLKVTILLRYKEFDQVANLSAPDPFLYNDALSYYKAALAVGAVRKNASLPTSFDRRAAAVKSFQEGELRCFLSNQRLSQTLFFRPPNSLLGDEDAIANFCHRVKQRFCRIVGEHAPTWMVGRHGNGATQSDPGKSCSIIEKFSSVPTMTIGALGVLPELAKTVWADAIHSHPDRPSEIDCVPGNRFASVPKTAKTDRGIAIEPSINVFYQLGVARVLRRRLKAMTGIDLHNQQAIHRELALAGSIDGSLATIDLSAASDSVSHSLVEFLCPPEWYYILNALRSPFTEIDGRQYRVEKFSTMGNGYTFELETLIFSSIAMAVAERFSVRLFTGVNFSVFGDDIIVPTEIAEPLVSALRWFGFEVNKGKTFLTGPFRESCGGDFFLGDYVTPIYWKEEPNDPASWISLHNQIIGTFGGDGGLFFSHTLRLIREFLPDVARLYGPAIFGDIVLHCDDPRKWTSRCRNGIFQVKVYRPVPRIIRYYGRIKDRPFFVKKHKKDQPWMINGNEYSRWRPASLLCAALVGADTIGFTPRKGVAGYRTGWATLYGTEWLPA